MKKVMLVLVATVFAANVFAQSATTPSTQPATKTNVAPKATAKNQQAMSDEKADLKKDEATLNQLNSQYKDAVAKKDKAKQEQLTAQIKKVKSDIASDKKTIKNAKASTANDNKSMAATTKSKQPNKAASK